MTREEKEMAINQLQDAKDGYKEYLTDKVLDMAIKALSQGSCSNAVSRQAALNALYALCDTGETLKENPWRDNPHIDALVDAIEELPPVNPQPKIGHWIEDTNGTYTDNHDTWECSECGHAQILLEGTPKDNDYNYCPNCGAKMESEGKE